MTHLERMIKAIQMSGESIRLLAKKYEIKVEAAEESEEVILTPGHDFRSQDRARYLTGLIEDTNEVIQEIGETEGLEKMREVRAMFIEEMTKE